MLLEKGIGSTTERILPSGLKVIVRELNIDEVGNLKDPKKDPLKRIQETLSTALLIVDETGTTEHFDAKKALEPDLAAGIFYLRKELLGDDFSIKIECPTEFCNFGKESRGFNPEFFKIELIDELVKAISKDVYNGMYLMELKNGQTAIMKIVKGSDIIALNKANMLAEGAKIKARFEMLCVGIVVDKDTKENEDKITTVTLDKVYRVRPLVSKDDLHTRDYLKFESVYTNMVGGLSLDFEKRCPSCGSYCVEVITKINQIPFFIPDLFFSESRL